MPAGYSGTPLAKKLGIKPGMVMLHHNAPGHYGALLGELPDNTRWVDETFPDGIDFIHVFLKQTSELSASFQFFKPLMTPKGMLWISWPKKSSKIASDLNRDLIREVGLAAGLVDVKVCAVDEDWSGLKFVYRVKDRG